MTRRYRESFDALEIAQKDRSIEGALSWKEQVERARQRRTGGIPRTGSPIIFRSSSPPRRNQQIKASPRANLYALLFISSFPFFCSRLSSPRAWSFSASSCLSLREKGSQLCWLPRPRTQEKLRRPRKKRERVKTFTRWPLSLDNWPHPNLLYFCRAFCSPMDFLSREEN